jgi:hypothetical protein
MADVIIRIATIDDAIDIAAVHVRSWQTAYRGMIPDDFLASQSVEKRLPMWLRRLADRMLLNVPLWRKWTASSPVFVRLAIAAIRMSARRPASFIRSISMPKS